MILIERELIINKDIANSWEILGPGFVDAHKWASVVKHSVGKGSGINGAPCAERGCDISGMGKVREMVTQYSDERHVLSYRVAEGMPSMVKNATNTWRLFDLGSGKTKLVMVMELKVGGLMGMLMKPMMRMQMSRIATAATEDFKHYVETGEPHPRKIKAMKK